MGMIAPTIKKPHKKRGWVVRSGIRLLVGCSTKKWYTHKNHHILFDFPLTLILSPEGRGNKCKNILRIYVISTFVLFPIMEDTLP
jgi:hypothetical protein